MLIPYSTDAPVYHRPVGTIGLIVVNALVFILLGPGPQGWSQPLWLALGDGWHPMQWLTSVFVHGSFSHIAGNMLFLWVFGLVVEGKVGWRRFLACYLVAGVGESMLYQGTHLRSVGPPFFAGGASAAIFGLMAMAAIWAPANVIEFKLNVPYSFGAWIWQWRDIGREALDRDGELSTFDVRIDVLAGLYILLNVIEAARGAGSGVAHLGGVLFGVPLGLGLLLSGKVDCEGWDAISLLTQRRRGHFDTLDARRSKARDAVAASQRADRRHDETREEIGRRLAAGDFLGAQHLRREVRDEGADAPLASADLERLGRGLAAAKAWADAASVLDECVQSCPLGSDGVRLLVARIRVAHLDDPAGALAALDGIDGDALSPEEAALAAKIAATCRRMTGPGRPGG